MKSASNGSIHAGSATGIDLDALADRTEKAAILGTENQCRDELLAIAALARATPQHPRPTDDHLWDETMRDRDQYHEWADKLAGAIAIHFGVDIGEHSNMNCPWAEALEAIENAPPPGDNTLLASAYASFSAAVEKHIPRTADAAAPQHSVTEQAQCQTCGMTGWHVCYKPRAQPLASTAATQPEQASIRRWEDRAAEKYPAIPMNKLAPWAKLVEAKAEIRDLRAALAIPASTADSEQQASRTVLAHNVTPQPPGPTVEEMQQALAGVEIITVDDAIARGIPLVDGEQQASVSDATLESALMDVLTQHTELSTDAIDERVPQLVSAIRATIPSEADERAKFDAYMKTPAPDDYDASVKDAWLIWQEAWRAALTHRATTATPGYKLVPLVPTKEMYDAARLAWCVTPSFDVEAIYKAMLAATPDIATTAADQQGAAQPPQSDPKSPQSEGAAQAKAGGLLVPDGWIAAARIAGELTSVAFRDEQTARAACVDGVPFPFVRVDTKEGA